MASTGHGRDLPPSTRAWTAVATGCCLLVLLGAVGCGGGGHAGVRTELQPFTPQQLEMRQAAENAHYRLRVGDRFTIDFKYQDELDQHNITILPDGRFTMAGLEDVRVSGMTIPELDSLVTAHFAADYRNPELSIIMEDLVARQVYVLGEVRIPGLYNLPVHGEGVLQAVALAGGFLPTAATTEALLIRVANDGILYRHCDLSHLEKRSLEDLAYFDVQPFDVIYVPRSAVGDLAQFSATVLSSLVNLSGLFWDVYAIANIDKATRIVR